jgi:hypothetical protein
VRSWKKGGGAVDVGLEDLYHTLELIFTINVIFVIVCVTLLSSTSHFVFVFILKMLEKTFFHDEDQNLVM